MRDLLKTPVLSEVTEGDINENLIRNREYLHFVMNHISPDFLEVNIRTKKTKSINYMTGEIRESMLLEQVTWFAENMIVPNEREKYKEEFKLERILHTLRENGGSKRSVYNVAGYGDGRYIQITYGLKKYLGEEYILSFVQDITQFIEQEERNRELVDISRQLLQISQVDQLTQLYNRTAGETFVQELLYKTNGVLLVLDIDRFKKINDQFGHKAGDAALKFVGNAILESFRSGDVLCRWGGDEFLIFMVNNKKRSGVESRIERLRIKIRYCIEEAKDHPLTISVGGVFTKQGENLNDLFARADRELYRVKQNGRDGFCMEDK